MFTLFISLLLEYCFLFIFSYSNLLLLKWYSSSLLFVPSTPDQSGPYTFLCDVESTQTRTEPITVIQAHLTLWPWTWIFDRTHHVISVLSVDSTDNLSGHPHRGLWDTNRGRVFRHIHQQIPYNLPPSLSYIRNLILDRSLSVSIRGPPGRYESSDNYIPPESTFFTSFRTLDPSLDTFFPSRSTRRVGPHWNLGSPN